MSGPPALLALLLLFSTAIIAFYWYFRHRRSEIDLRRDEGEHYERARGRLSRLTGRDGQPPPPDRDGPPSPSAVEATEMRGAKGIRKSTVDAVSAALEVWSVETDDATVYLIGPPPPDRLELLVATPIGLIEATHAEIPGRSERYQLTTKLRRWTDVRIEVSNETDHYGDEGFVTSVEVNFPREGWTFRSDTRRESEESSPGLIEFAQACLRYTANGSPPEKRTDTRASP
jgi:hypothetical protein